MILVSPGSSIRAAIRLLNVELKTNARSVQRTRIGKSSRKSPRVSPITTSRPADSRGSHETAYVLRVRTPRVARNFDVNVDVASGPR